MSDITPMAAVPSEVNYGRIRANFVAFIADDNGNVLEEVPLEGNVILTPTVGVLRFPSTSPPRTAVIQTLQCPVIGGILYPPGTPLGGPFPSQTGVAAVASDQPAGLPTTVQWTASFSLENTSAQPNPVTFEVPSGGVVDLTTVMPATPEPGIVVVVSTESRDRAEAAAAAATQKATAAASSATAAATSATNAATSASAAASSATAAQTAAAALQDTGWRDMSADLNTEAFIIPSGGMLALRRIGDRVVLRGRLQTTAALPISTRILLMPLDFRSPITGVILGIARNGPTIVPLHNATASTGIYAGAAFDTGATLAFEITWTTDRGWPTTLPGTPA